MKRIHLFALFIATGALLVTSPSLRASEADDGIESAAGKPYVFMTFLKDDKIKAESRDGVVTLTGTVVENSHKDLAQDTVENLPGVKEVKNKMTVATAPAQPERTSAEKIDDASITAQVKSSLMARRSTSALKTMIETTGGVATIRGIAKDAAQKSLVTKLVNDINGVTRVVNHMTIPVAVSRDTIAPPRVQNLRIVQN